MQIKRVLLLLITTTLWQSARADEVMKKAIGELPGDTLLAFYVPSVMRVDTIYQAASRNLGLAMFIPPDFSSLSGIIKNQLPMMADLDQEKPILFSLLKREHFAEFSDAFAWYIPTQQPEKLLTAAGGTKGEDGNWSVAVGLNTYYASSEAEQVILAGSLATLQAIKEAETHLSDRIEEDYLEPLTGMDLVVWMDFAHMLGMDDFQMVMNAGAAAQAAVEGEDAVFASNFAEYNRRQFEFLSEGLQSMVYGFRWGKTGIDNRCLLQLKPESVMARQSIGLMTADNLLTGLPGGSYLFAEGVNPSQDQLKASLETVDSYFDLFKGVEGIKVEELEELRAKVKATIMMQKAYRFSLNRNASGENGLFSGYFIIDTESSAEFIQNLSSCFEKCMSMAKGFSSKESAVGFDSKQILEAIAFRSDAEEIGEHKASLLTFDYSTIQSDLLDDISEYLPAVLGDEKLTARVVAANNNLVCISIGGGAEAMKTLLASAKAGGSTLDEDPGIQGSTATHPKERSAVAYIAIDEFVRTFNAYQEIIEEEALPLQIPNLQAPLGITVSESGESRVQLDVFVPNKVIAQSIMSGFILFQMQNGRSQ